MVNFDCGVQMQQPQTVQVSNLPPGQNFLKLMVPSYAAGAIIGKQGQIIVKMQQDAKANIKLSKNNDLYPGRIVSLIYTIKIYNLGNVKFGQ